MTGARVPWYVQFFEGDYLRAYGHTLTPERAEREAAFVAEALALQPGERVLDLCCGPGRHAVLLARRGLALTGLDLNAGYLEMARHAARDAGVAMETVQADMRQIPFEARFDAVISMFTAFGYLESEAEDQRVLQAVACALRPGGRLLMDTISREWVVSHYVQNEWQEGGDGDLLLESRELDLLTSRNRVRFTMIGRDGTRRESPGIDLRLYTLTELAGMLRQAGLGLQRAYGGFDGEPYTVATRRMILVARKG